MEHVSPVTADISLLQIWKNSVFQPVQSLTYHVKNYMLSRMTDVLLFVL